MNEENKINTLYHKIIEVLPLISIKEKQQLAKILLDSFHVKTDVYYFYKELVDRARIPKDMLDKVLKYEVLEKPFTDVFTFNDIVRVERPIEHEFSIKFSHTKYILK